MIKSALVFTLCLICNTFNSIKAQKFYENDRDGGAFQKIYAPETIKSTVSPATYLSLTMADSIMWKAIDPNRDSSKAYIIRFKKFRDQYPRSKYDTQALIAISNAFETIGNHRRVKQYRKEILKKKYRQLEPGIKADHSVYNQNNYIRTSAAFALVNYYASKGRKRKAKKYIKLINKERLYTVEPYSAKDERKTKMMLRQLEAKLGKSAKEEE